MGRIIRFAIFIGGTVFILAVGGYALFFVKTDAPKLSEAGTAAARTAQKRDTSRDTGMSRLEGVVALRKFYQRAIEGGDPEGAMSIFSQEDGEFYEARKRATWMVADKVRMANNRAAGVVTGGTMKPTSEGGLVGFALLRYFDGERGHILDRYAYQVQKHGDQYKIGSLPFKSAQDSVLYYDLHGSALYQLKRYDQARAQFRKVLDRATTPEDKVDAYWYLSDMDFQQGAYQDALSHCEKGLAMASAGDSVRILLQMGKVYAGLKQEEKAKGALTQVIESAGAAGADSSYFIEEAKRLMKTVSAGSGK